MIERYSRKLMREIWSEQNKYEIWLKLVYFEISVHLKPSFLIDLYVPPELIILTPNFLRTFNKLLKFFLSETDIRAFLIF